MIKTIEVDNIIKISTNKIYAGIHFRVRVKHKKDYLWLTKTMFKKLEPITEKVDLKFTFHFTKSPLDSSNCSYMGKLLEDCLVTYGVLKNDTIKYVGNVTYESVKSKEKRPDWCVINIIKEIEEFLK